MASWQERYLNPIVIVLAALLAAAVVTIVLDRRDEQALEIRLGEPTPGGPIEVYITGAVARPGVYELVDGDRIIDLLRQAGDFAEDAKPQAINLAQRLHDEDMIVVPRLGEPASQVAGAVSLSVNINTATARELDAALPGIGEVYSQRIVDSRTSDGPFTATDDLVIRDLVPRGTYENIKHLINVGQ